MALPIFPGRPTYCPAVLTVRWTVKGREKPPHKREAVIMLALPIFPASHPASIVGANELNFCVRDGNRWTLAAINTNFVVAVRHFMSKASMPKTSGL